MSCVSHCAQAPGSNESCVEGKADLSCVSSRNARLLNFRANSCFYEISELRKRQSVMSWADSSVLSLARRCQITVDSHPVCYYDARFSVAALRPRAHRRWKLAQCSRRRNDDGCWRHRRARRQEPRDSQRWLGDRWANPGPVHGWVLKDVQCETDGINLILVETLSIVICNRREFVWWQGSYFLFVMLWIQYLQNFAYICKYSRFPQCLSAISVFGFCMALVLFILFLAKALGSFFLDLLICFVWKSQRKSLLFSLKFSASNLYRLFEAHNLNTTHNTISSANLFKLEIEISISLQISGSLSACWFPRLCLVFVACIARAFQLEFAASRACTIVNDVLF